MFLKEENIFLEQLRDPKRTAEFFGKYRMIPYGGTRKNPSHLYQKFLYDMFDLSYSEGNCISSLKKWSFEGGFYVTNQTSPYFLTQNFEEEIDRVLEEEFIFFLEEHGIDGETLARVNDDVWLNYKRTGTGYLRYREVWVGGMLNCSIESLNPLMTTFLDSEKGDPEAVIISKDFIDVSEITESELVRVYPDWTEREDGVYETVFVLRNKRDWGDLYGRPDSLHSTVSKWIEWSSKLHMAKSADNELVAKSLVLMEEPPMNIDSSSPHGNSGFSVEGIGRALRDLMTNRGKYYDSKGLGVLSYPKGGKEPMLLNFDVDRDYEWSDHTLSKASESIYGSHDWSRILTSQNDPSQGIGGNVLLDTFKVKNNSTIKPIQRKMSWFWKSTVLKRLIEATGRKEFEKLGIAYRDKIGEMIESMNPESQKTAQIEDVIK
jgi:hypothetical protein